MKLLCFGHGDNPEMAINREVVSHSYSQFKMVCQRVGFGYKAIG